MHKNLFPRFYFYGDYIYIYIYIESCSPNLTTVYTNVFMYFFFCENPILLEFFVTPKKRLTQYKNFNPTYISFYEGEGMDNYVILIY